MSLKIRLLQQADLGKVESIANQVQENSWSHAVFADCMKAGYVGWVLEKNEVVVGFLVVLIQDDECQLMNIGIDQQHWRQGYAKKLLEHLFEYLSAVNVSHVLLEVRASNQAAINLYLAHQFKQIGIRKNYYPMSEGREDALVFCYLADSNF
jgi:ribosomal-protein-alanine N-acetyltransferase